MWSTCMTHAKQPLSSTLIQKDYFFKLFSSSNQVVDKYLFHYKHSCGELQRVVLDAWTVGCSSREFSLKNIRSGSCYPLKPLLLVEGGLSPETATFVVRDSLPYKQVLRNTSQLFCQEANISVALSELSSSSLSDDESESGDDSSYSDSDTDSSNSTSDDDASDSEDDYYSYDEGISDYDSEEDYLYSDDDEEEILSESDDDDE
ncbi:hypothetical protein Gasu2_03800 [Galdieria sulphuraria]|uniref:Uncharacterized protein n=1 Tax=Galdieria sulphuraria TaxID=130081 RepID=M2WYW6_GALSU|nr:uncharacterized protein Gasu_32660 [Galdieria sulphuraria]EME29255.1 hypothetical protein Gasu_32660 [Galdieria sulphuraria]GJD05936.1 hypothetical protein Gasu2_03800 [Galdieria sulphuraria]|eukprot:XP_005705775.1 hypothetical protein Gasu_32660 [Galdieria sulphuraria]